MTNSIRKVLAAIPDAVQAEGLVLVGIQKSVHLKVWVAFEDRTGLWVVSSTSSDNKRGWRNALCDLRRLARKLKEQCRTPALSLVVPQSGSNFVGLQTNTEHLSPLETHENLCRAGPFCRGINLPNLGRSG